MLTRDTSYVAPNLLTRVELRAYARKDYAAVEIYLRRTLTFSPSGAPRKGFV